jgi:hypothetical protein
MLTNPHDARWTLSTIAFAAGFGDVPYFNRRFRRRCGMRPSDVRQCRRRSREPFRATHQSNRRAAKRVITRSSGRGEHSSGREDMGTKVMAKHRIYTTSFASVFAQSGFSISSVNAWTLVF